MISIEDYWKEHQPASYSRWNLEWENRPAGHKLPRRTLHWLIAERSGHGDYEAYHLRFGHENTHSQCICGEKREAGHLAECRLTKEQMDKLQGKEDPLAYLLGPKGSEDFQALVESTGIYRGQRARAVTQNNNSAVA